VNWSVLPISNALSKDSLPCGRDLHKLAAGGLLPLTVILLPASLHFGDTQSVTATRSPVAKSQAGGRLMVKFLQLEVVATGNGSEIRIGNYERRYHEGETVPAGWRNKETLPDEMVVACGKEVGRFSFSLAAGYEIVARPAEGGGA
jgi:hypothetical protein